MSSGTLLTLGGTFAVAAHGHIALVEVVPAATATPAPARPMVVPSLAAVQAGSW